MDNSKYSSYIDYRPANHGKDCRNLFSHVFLFPSLSISADHVIRSYVTQNNAKLMTLLGLAFAICGQLYGIAPNKHLKKVTQPVFIRLYH